MSEPNTLIVTLRDGIVGLATTPPKGVRITVRDYDINPFDQEAADENDHQVDEDGDTYWEYDA